MSTWDFNCPKFRGFLNDGESSDSDAEAYFDAVHPSPPATEVSSVFHDASDKSRNSGRPSRPYTRSRAAASALASPPLQESAPDPAKENEAPAKPSQKILPGPKPRGKPQSELALHAVKRATGKAKTRAPRKALCENKCQRDTKAASQAPKRPLPEQKTLAELVRNFERTPMRFRTHTAPQNFKRFRPTIPVTPHLATKLRSRPVKIETKAERDQRLVEELKKYRVRPSKVAPPRKAPRKEAEVVAGPSGHGESQRQASAPTSDRRKTRVVSAPAKPEHKFVARPPPKMALAGPTSKPPKTTARRTVAQSPAFALKARCESWNLKRKQAEEAKKEEAAVAAVPAKRPSRSRQRRNAPGQQQQQQQQQRPTSRQRSTTPQPFSFQTRQDEALRKKQARLQEMGQEEKEPQHFKAKPAPPALRVFRPRCRSAPVTSPAPFRLASLTRHEERKRNFQEQMEQMNKQLANLSKFVAKPCPTSRPFTAKLEQKHTVPDKVRLHSTTRAQQRHDFDSALSSRIQKRAAESEERKRAEEEAAIRELRRKTVFRANPVPRPKPAAARAAKRATPKATNSASSSLRARKPRRSPRNPTPGMK
ncbi:targeting protein for Xklp2-B isoform X2 [Ixodes scapularis]|uniref:targeting protein for Xklp2-B isoform X2 n=1 Tax=Ixodes scapularis TaxID=6945 RepID=UPI001C387CAD|nr:targeting protein for Xklp2-B isoform X2 [Ixodes scapularis]